jgi:glycerate 2-kinase
VLEVLGGELRTVRVTGPLGDPVDAQWRLAGDVAIIESARASGLVIAGGRQWNDAVAATTRGTGELIVAAIASGATRVVVGVGGSATTDGGIGALEAIDESGGIGDAEVLVACDVTVLFSQAAVMFAPQKGAGPVEIEILSRRLEDLAARYRDRGTDVSGVAGAGAAGGLAGGLLVAGAKIVSGIDLVASLVDLDGRMSRADLVVTGEGRLDLTSWEGKVVAGVGDRAARAHVGVVAIAGQVAPEAMTAEHRPSSLVEVIDLSAIFGADTAMRDAAACAELASEAVLASRLAGAV